MRLYIGIDNGVTGAIGIVSSDLSIVEWHKTPTIKTLSYTKKKQTITRVDIVRLKDILIRFESYNNKIAIIERPMTNIMRLKQTFSAMRSLEATLVVLEFLNIGYIFIDSKEWQKDMLGNGIKNKELKFHSKEVSKRLFPNIDFGKSDGDAILISEWARRKNL